MKGRCRGINQTTSNDGDSEGLNVRKADEKLDIPLLGSRHARMGGTKTPDRIGKKKGTAI